MNELEELKREVTLLKEELQLTKRQNEKVIRENKELKENLTFDSLTKVYTRLFFDKYMKDYLDTRKVYLALIDLNNLKEINDNKGHEAGDILLIDITSKLNKYGDVIRLGGDEFLLIMKDDKEFKLYAEEQKDFAYGVIRKEINEPIPEILGKIDELMYLKKEQMKSKR